MTTNDGQGSIGSLAKFNKATRCTVVLMCKVYANNKQNEGIRHRNGFRFAIWEKNKKVTLGLSITTLCTNVQKGSSGRCIVSNTAP